LPSGEIQSVPPPIRATPLLMAELLDLLLGERDLKVHQLLRALHDVVRQLGRRVVVFLASHY